MGNASTNSFAYQLDGLGIRLHMSITTKLQFENLQKIFQVPPTSFDSINIATYAQVWCLAFRAINGTYPTFVPESTILQDDVLFLRHNPAGSLVMPYDINSANGYWSWIYDNHVYHCNDLLYNRISLEVVGKTWAQYRKGPFHFYIKYYRADYLEVEIAIILKMASLGIYFECPDADDILSFCKERLGEI